MCFMLKLQDSDDRGFASCFWISGLAIVIIYVQTFQVAEVFKKHSETYRNKTAS